MSSRHRLNQITNPLQTKNWNWKTKLNFLQKQTNQANVRVAPDSRMTHAMPPVLKADSVWIARRRASARRGRPRHAILSRESVYVTPVTEAFDVKHSARKVDMDPNVALLAIARMTARAITWAIVSVNADGLVNCARIVVWQVIYYNYNLYCKSFHHLLFIYFRLGRFLWEKMPSALSSLRQR